MSKSNKCEICEKVVLKSTGVKVKLYDYPFEKTYREVWVHADMKNEDEYGRTCYDLLFDTGWADFRYFECSTCNRLVCRQAPANGWHSQVRTTDDGEEICLSCYEKELLENGVPATKFQRGILPGMFFSFGNSELKSKGWSEVLGFQNYYVNSDDSIKNICEKAMELIDKEGRKVVVAYERLGIGGGEGYVSLFVK